MFLGCAVCFLFCCYVCEFYLKRKLNLNDTLLNGPIFCQSASEWVCCLNLSTSQAQPIATMIHNTTVPRLSPMPQYLHVSDKTKSEGPSAFHSFRMFDILVLLMVFKG